MPGTKKMLINIYKRERKGEQEELELKESRERKRQVKTQKSNQKLGKNEN